MGCCSSNISADKLNTSFNECYGPSPARSSSKRSFADTSSGVFSRCTTPSRRSILSRSATPKPKPNNFNFQNINMAEVPKDIAMLSICDDFGEAQQHQQQHQIHQDLDKSYGYFSESMSGSGRSSSCAGSSPTKGSLVRTQDNSFDSMTKPASSLEMEMYMMTHAQQIMPKSSTPVCQRREATFVLSSQLTHLQQASQSYKKWCNYLQTTPAYLLHNVTNIPEAVAGHFSPANFPGFSDLEDMENAAKRFKVDTQYDDDSMYLRPALSDGLTHTIVTDLWLAILTAVMTTCFYFVSK